MIDNNLNKEINKVFYKVASDIYEGDKRENDTKEWWPIRPIYLDFAIAPYIFKELIKLLKLAKGKEETPELSKLFNSYEELFEFQYLWPSLGFSPTDISLEDKLFLIEEFINLGKTLTHEPNFVYTYAKLAQEIKNSSDKSLDNILKTGTRIYFTYLKPLYNLLDLDYEKSLQEAETLVLSRASQVKDPGSWGERSKEEAIRKIYRNSDFRRELEKDLDVLVRGVPGIPGIAQGEVGQNIFVVFTIDKLIPEALAYSTDIDAFKNIDKQFLIDNGIPVVSQTRVGTKRLTKSQKVLVDGTSGIVYDENP